MSLATLTREIMPMPADADHEYMVPDRVPRGMRHATQIGSRRFFDEQIITATVAEV